MCRIAGSADAGRRKRGPAGSRAGIAHGPARRRLRPVIGPVAQADGRCAGRPPALQ